jgi:hypothetical protein
MSQSISNMQQVWMSNTNTYNAIVMSVSTLGYGANTNSKLFKLNVDGNTKFSIDSTGNTAIGTTPVSTSRLTVGGAGGSISVTGSDASWSAGGNRAFMDYDGHGRFGTATGGGSATSGVQIISDNIVGLAIDPSGRVTKPYQPFFLGYPTTDYSSGSMPTQVMAVTSYYNNGNCFNGSTNRFTCPVTGWYRVTWGGLQLPSTVTSLQVNSSDVHNGNHYVGTPSYITVTQTTLRQQSAGDYFTIRQWNGGGYYSGWWLWSVELVG